MFESGKVIKSQHIIIIIIINFVLEANSEKSKYVVVSLEQYAGQYHNIKMGNNSFERLEQLKYLETTPMNQNSIYEKIKSRCESGSACHNSVQNLSSSSFLSKGIKIKVHRTLIVPVVLCGCAAWSLTLREERKLKVFENRVLRQILGLKRDEVIGSGENCIATGLMLCTPYQILFG